MRLTTALHALTAALLFASVGGVAGAQSSNVGLLVVAHGADSAWNANVRETVKKLRWNRGPVEVAFLMGDEAKSASWGAALTSLQNANVARVVAVPLMVSTFGSHVDQIRFYAGELASMPKELESMLAAMGHTHDAPVHAHVPIATTNALDDASELGQALYERWTQLPVADRRRPLVLVAHGPNDADDAVLWEKNLSATTTKLAQLVAPNVMRIHLLRDDAPADVRKTAVQAMRDSISALATRAHDSVTVLPVLISTGAVNTVKIPADIAGLPVRYHSMGLTPSVALAQWIDRVAAAKADEMLSTKAAR